MGKLKISAKDVIGLAPAKGESGVWLLLADGQAIIGKLKHAVIHLKLAIGSTLDIPLSSLRECSYRISDAKPAAKGASGPMILLRNGQRLAWTDLKQQMQLLTPYGKIPLPIDILVGIDWTGRDYRVRTANGIQTGRFYLHFRKINDAWLNVRDYTVGA